MQIFSAFFNLETWLGRGTSKSSKCAKMKWSPGFGSIFLQESFPFRFVPQIFCRIDWHCNVQLTIDGLDFDPQILDFLQEQSIDNSGCNIVEFEF